MSKFMTENGQRQGFDQPLKCLAVTYRMSDLVKHNGIDMAKNNPRKGRFWFRIYEVAAPQTNLVLYLMHAFVCNYRDSNALFWILARTKCLFLCSNNRSGSVPL